MDHAGDCGASEHLHQYGKESYFRRHEKAEGTKPQRPKTTHAAIIKTLSLSLSDEHLNRMEEPISATFEIFLAAKNCRLFSYTEKSVPF